MRTCAAVMVLGISCAAWTCACRGSAAGGEDGRGTVLCGESLWRAHFEMESPVIVDGGKKRAAKSGALVVNSPPAPEDWMKAEFDDSGWPRWRPTAGLRKGGEFGYTCSNAPGPCVRAIRLRGRFLVPERGRGTELVLSLAYRGGAVVYLNGQEIARGHLPATSAGNGDGEGSALASEYPPEAFTGSRGRPIRWGFGDPGKYREGLAKRVRRLEDLKITRGALRRGVNVLAVEIRAAPYYLNEEASGFRDRHYSTWGSCGLADVKLAGGGAVVESDAPPSGMLVRVHPAGQLVTVIDRGDPNESCCPLRLAGARGGAFSGQLVVWPRAAVSGLRAEASELRSAGGKTISSSDVRVRWAVPDGENWRRGLRRFYALEESPPDPAVAVGAKNAAGAVQPLWVTVAVPAEAAAGTYRGEVAVSAAGAKTVKVPVEISVAGWKLPPSREFTGFVDVIQSPRSVALQYGVRPWSARHWKLIEKSFELMGEVGAKVVYVTVLPRTYFGNEHGMVRWIRKSDGSYDHDFSVAERYLDLAAKHLGRPPVVCVYLWDRRAGMINYDGRDFGRGKGTPFTLLDPATGKMTEEEGPRWGTPEARAFWKPVVEGLRKRLAERGLEKSMMWGLASDRRPRKETVEDLRAMAPEVPWVCHSHPRAEKIHGQRVGYIAHVWGATPLSFCRPPEGRRCGWKRKVLLTTFPRMSSGGAGTLLGAPAQKYRLAPEAIVAAGYRGLGRMGGDFWDVLADKRGRKSTVLRTDEEVGETWGIGLECAVQRLLGAGRDGPVSSVRLEALRESLQETEARVFLERALADTGARGRLGAALSKRCREVLDRRTWDLLAAIQSPDCLYWIQEGTERTRLLYATAAEVAKRLEQ